MNIDIKVSERQSDINPATLQRMRRMINFLCDIDCDVTLSFKDGELHDNSDEYAQPYMGGKYPHNGYIIRMVKDTNKKLDAPNYKTIYNAL